MKNLRPSKHQTHGIKSEPTSPRPPKPPSQMSDELIEKAINDTIGKLINENTQLRELLLDIINVHINDIDYEFIKQAKELLKGRW